MKKQKVKAVHLVCSGCGVTANYLTCLQKYGQPPIKKAFTVSTYHKGKCDYCGEKTSVTEVRDFFYPDFTLIDKVKELLKNNEGFIY
jgi:hypothetical protein